MNRTLTLPALILVDEVGAGTDPIEGGALGRAIVDHFRERGAHIIATTHDEALKAYGATTEDVVCAAFGFNPETFAPTYQLAYGSTGQSLALEIAERLGLDQSVIKAATELRSTRETQLANHLAQLEADRHQLNEWKDSLQQQEARLGKQTSELAKRETKLQQWEQRGNKSFEDTLDTKLRTAQEEVEVIVTTLRTKVAALESKVLTEKPSKRQPLSTGDHGTLRAEAQAELKKVAIKYHDSTVKQPETINCDKQMKIGVGSLVRVSTLNLEGTVQSIHGTDAEIEVDGKRLLIHLDSLNTVARSRIAADVNSHVKINVRTQTTSLHELNLIGCRVDEALSRVEKHVDQALMSEQRTVRFIHGHGTGQLRQAIAGFLETHPLVTRVSAAPPEEGGHGVTIAKLKE